MPLVTDADGQDAEFLWLASSRVASQTVWAEFKGRLLLLRRGRWPSRGPPSTPRARRGGRLEGPAGESDPIAMAGQFYGSGSVFFLGSGETWRLRGIDDATYERFVTQLARHVSQGRLLPRFSAGAAARGRATAMPWARA
jgi:hypothetical protein